MKELARALGVGEAVDFRGRVEDVYAELAEQDFYLSASTMEGQSNALLEAMACGCVPLVADASGVTDVVAEGERGFIFPSIAPGVMAQTMSQALSLPDGARRAMSVKAHQFAEETFGIDAVARRTLARMGELKRAAGGGR